jgi:cell division protein ZapA
MIQVDVSIMGQPYRLACKQDEERMLREAAAYLDGKMSALREAGKVKGNDRIAVMAAISMAAELLSVKAPQGPFSDLTMVEIKHKLGAMQTVLDAALAPQELLF